MYTNSQNGQAAARTAAPTLHLGTYRRAIMAAMSADVFTPAERLRADHSVYESQDSARLALWLTNVTRVRDEREQASNAKLEAALERGRQLVTGIPTEAFATPAQCDEVFRLASALPKAEKTDALRRLPTLTELEAQAFIQGLNLRRGSRLRLPVTLGKHLVQVPIAERHFEAARVDYVADPFVSKVLPRYETLMGGPVVRQLWNN